MKQSCARHGSRATRPVSRTLVALLDPQQMLFGTEFRREDGFDGFALACNASESRPPRGTRSDLVELTLNTLDRRQTEGLSPKSRQTPSLRLHRLGCSRSSSLFCIRVFLVQDSLAQRTRRRLPRLQDTSESQESVCLMFLLSEADLRINGRRFGLVVAAVHLQCPDKITAVGGCRRHNEALRARFPPASVKPSGATSARSGLP